MLLENRVSWGLPVTYIPTNIISECFFWIHTLTAQMYMFAHWTKKCSSQQDFNWSNATYICHVHNTYFSSIHYEMIPIYLLTSRAGTIYLLQRNAQMTAMQKRCLCTIGWPMSWRINYGVYKWVNSVLKIFWYKLLPTIYGHQNFPKDRFLKVNYFCLPMHLTNEL